MEPRLLDALARCRRELRRLGLLGATPEGVGFGNISVRAASGGFVITGSATGSLESLDLRHYALVEEARIEENWLACKGLTAASSESLTHAAVYGVLPWVGAVIHVHCALLWERLAGRLPTTPAGAGYGTPQMAGAIADLARGASAAAVLVMGGHRDGLIAFGADLDAAAAPLLDLRGAARS